MQESYIHDNLGYHILSLPEGLQELMSDISREVLRAQPQNVYSFIANYLSALLEVRKNIFIASHICNSIEEYPYQPVLIEELSSIGLAEEDIVKAMTVIEQFFKTGTGKETNLFLKILRTTNIGEYRLEAIQGAIQNAFRRLRLNQCQTAKSSSASTCDNISLTSLAGSLVSLPRYKPYSVYRDTPSAAISKRKNVANSSKLKDRELSTNIRSDTDIKILKRYVTFKADTGISSDEGLKEDRTPETDSITSSENTETDISTECSREYLSISD